MRKTLWIAIFTLALGSAGAVAGEYDGRWDGDDYGGNYPDYKRFFRMDCRFHNAEKHKGANFCYSSAVYQIGHGKVRNLHLGIGCDNQTFFNDKARVHVETTLDRLSPLRAATPALEVFPQGQLNLEGTYTSVLDIHLGRFQGLCYVHKLWEDRRDDHGGHGDHGDQDDHQGGHHGDQGGHHGDHGGQDGHDQDDHGQDDHGQDDHGQDDHGQDGHDQDQDERDGRW